MDLAIWSISRVEVLVQRMAEGLHTASSSLKILFFRPMFSNTASTICVRGQSSSSSSSQSGQIRKKGHKIKPDDDDSVAPLPRKHPTCVRLSFTGGIPTDLLPGLRINDNREDHRI